MIASIINSSRHIGIKSIHPSIPRILVSLLKLRHATHTMSCHAMLPTAVEISAIYNYVINFDRSSLLLRSHNFHHFDGIHSPRLSSLPIESSVVPEPVGLAAASGR